MLQDEGKEILRHAAKYLQKSWKTTGDFDDYQAVNLLKWMFTAEPKDAQPADDPFDETVGEFGFACVIHNDRSDVQPRSASMDQLFENWDKHDVMREELLAKTV